MRPSLLFALSISLAFSPLAQSESSQDGGDLFADAYTKAQQGEKEEQAGHLVLALSKLKKAARTLNEIEKKFPLWSPMIVKYRKERTVNAITRVADEIAKSKLSSGGKSADGGASAQKGDAVPKDLTDQPRLLLWRGRLVLPPDDWSKYYR